MSPTASPGGFSLFPSPNASKTPPIKTTPRPPRAGTPQSTRGRDMSIDPRNGRHSPEAIMSEYVVDSSSSPMAANEPRFAPSNPFYHHHHNQAAGSSSQFQPEPESPPPPSLPPKDEPPRTDAAISGTSQNPSASERLRSSIAKLPLEDDASPAQLEESATTTTAIRSMFPRYDHTLAFDQQHYYPTQASPTHIPRTVISRQSHVPQQIEPRSPPIRSPVNEPPQNVAAAPVQQQQQHWPRRNRDAPAIPTVSTTEELRDYWKAANGWKASSMEGRTYCLKLVPEHDAPVYTLMSRSGQPVYHMRIDPTSAASAYVTLSRHDPGKVCKDREPPSENRNSGLLNALRTAESESSSSNRQKQPWQEAMTTTLEEPSRHLPPNDGLIALLYPSAAARVAIEKRHDASAVAAAERECARLVWDDDSGNYFLAHPALASPFCVTVERTPSYSRTEYAIEHVESPHPLARLTRMDGTGEGHLELDTLVAGRVDAFYVLDVAVAALLLVARTDRERNSHINNGNGSSIRSGSVEHHFDPPPAAHLRDSPSSRSGSRSAISSRLSLHTSTTKKNKKQRMRLEPLELDLDLESQTSSSLKKKKGFKYEEDEPKLPTAARAVIKILGFGFKCVVWVLTLAFRVVTKIVVGLTR
ncbi:hypothetical protein F5Y17DRAFT_210152 [Xylariaceae sp. FL0594]|nr:hypothetical protein F5Y17DRAFT_210152 [Xylariaceae sp. FL0594]